MEDKTIGTIKAPLEILGINPFVFVPEPILQALFVKVGRLSGPIPIKGEINGKPYIQTLVKYSGEWRLYVNTTMLKNSPQRIGEQVEITVAYDPVSRAFEMPAEFEAALKKNELATQVFASLSNSMKQEIVRYLARLKTQESLDRNVVRAIRFLEGKERFIGRDKP